MFSWLYTLSLIDTLECLQTHMPSHHIRNQGMRLVSLSVHCDKVMKGLNTKQIKMADRSGGAKMEL
jgi:hypothetical protein